MTLNNTVISCNQYIPLKLSLNGNLLSQENVNIENPRELYREAGNINHQYYRTELNSLVGPAGIAGLYDVFTTCFMWLNERGAAPVTNFCVSLADYIQVYIARTKLLGNPETDPIAKQRRVGAMAWTQVLAGVGGLGSFVKDLVLGNGELSNNSVSKKLSLSVSSLFAATTMLTTYSEKMITATTSKGKDQQGNEIKGIVLDANNDIRAAVEYAVMAVYPWVSQIRPIKQAIDLMVPIFALRDGMENFIHDGISKVFKREPNTQFSQGIRNFFKTILFINEESDKTSKAYIPRIFCSDWFLGIGKFRDKCLKTIYEFLGCKNIPKVNLTQENGKEMLVLQTVGEALKDFTESSPIKNEGRQPSARQGKMRETQQLVAAVV